MINEPLNVHDADVCVKLNRASGQDFSRRIPNNCFFDNKGLPASGKPCILLMKLIAEV